MYEEKEPINCIPIILIIISPILLMGMFIVTNNFSTKPSLPQGPLYSILLGIASLVTSILGYKIARDEADMSYSSGTERIYVSLGAVGLGFAVLAAIFIVLTLLFYFVGA